MLQMTGEEGVRETLETEHLPQAKGAILIFFILGFIVTQAQRVKNLIAMQETWV